MPVRVLTESELRAAIGPDTESLKAVEAAFSAIALGQAEMPPIMHIGVPEGGGDVDVKSAYLRGEPLLAIKIAAGFAGNPELGLPTGSGMMVALSTQTGRCEAVLLDEGYLTDLRTGLAGAVAARHLAPETVETAGVLGAGVQAGYQIECLRLVRRFSRVLVWSRDSSRADRYAAEMTEKLGLEVRVAPSAEAVVRGSDCVITTTASREPIVRSAWLHPGLHITAMGSDLPGKRELEPGVLEQADRVVCDCRVQSRRLGELQQLSEDECDRIGVVELGELTSGRLALSREPDQVSVCDLTGTGAQDTAIALLALRRATAAGHGVDVGS